ncbi:hypothetical protein [Halobacillus karajensis]|uniref:Uncharacterized protein n=1 Tax=Halobacillus karajensis TaxID=195088 RepID=A0A059NWC0_9BACI|nr:hypothetical protein [Halobacillus karajensis]CDQ22623.1 hypothetical protein BN983_00836 [Halobacillus karajensis]CDQ26105.1 hypothetical protein BN981_00316 [Halobacillus karajensis]
MKKEMEITFANGYTVGLFEYKGELRMDLINPSGYGVSDLKLTETEVNTMQKIIEAHKEEK